MKKTLLFLIILASCSSRASMMTKSSYEGIQTGTPVTTIEAQVGQPYAIHSKGSGVEEYEYIERITMGNALVTETHYFLIVADGKVVGKYSKQEQSPEYDLIYQDDPNHHWYP